MTRTAEMLNCLTMTRISKFTYDGDGTRVMQVQTHAPHATAGSQLVALRQYTSPTNSVPYYLHGDHPRLRGGRLWAAPA